MKGRLQEKKKILILVVRLRPLGLDASQNPKDLLLNLVFGSRLSDFSLGLFSILSFLFLFFMNLPIYHFLHSFIPEISQ